MPEPIMPNPGKPSERGYAKPQPPRPDPSLAERATGNSARFDHRRPPSPSYVDNEGAGWMRPYAKTITAVCTGLIGWGMVVTSSAPAPVTASEWLGLAVALATAAGVFQVANA